MDNRNERTKKLYLISWATFIGIYVLDFRLLAGGGKIGVALLSLLALAGTAFLNYADTYRNGYGVGGIVALSIIVGTSYNFSASTARYVQLGYNYDSMRTAWRRLGIFFVLLIIVIVISRKVGKKRAKDELGY